MKLIFSKKVKTTHIWRRRQARSMFRDLCKSPPPPGRLFSRVRAMDPLAFEELVIEAFEKRNMKVKRSPSYSGDGGLDGEVKIKGVWHLLQMKRYEGNIKPADVRAFVDLCAKKKASGVFVHSGKTTPGVREAMQDVETVSLISGQGLVDLLTGAAMDLKYIS